MQRAPGQKLLALARRMLSRAELDRVIEPAIADLQHEWKASRRLSLSLQLFVRTRSYLGALRVIGPRLIVGSVSASLAPPPRPLVLRFLTLSIIQLSLTAVGFSFVDRLRGTTGDQWLFYLPDHVIRLLPVVPMFWVSWLGRGPLGGPAITAHAGDVAKLTAGVVAVCLVWSGWIAPLLRQEYLVAHNLSEFATAAMHQWTIAQLLANLNGVPSTPAPVVAAELHMRLMDSGLPILWATLGWLHIRGARVWNTRVGFGVMFAGLAAAVGLVSIADVVTSARTQERFVAEWASVVTLLVMSAIALRSVARIERRCRADLEAKAVSLLQAIARARQTQGHHTEANV